MLIPFVILYLLWEKRDRLATVAASPSWLGLLPLGLGIGLFWLGVKEWGRTESTS